MIAQGNRAGTTGWMSRSRRRAGWILAVAGGLCLSLTAWAGEAVVSPGDDLQAVLDRGDDLVLQAGKTYPVTRTLYYRKPGQRVFTGGVRHPADFAVLRIADRGLLQLISAARIEGAVLEHVTCDGRRYDYGIPPRDEAGATPEPPLVLFGERGGHNQVVRECVFLNARTWSTLKVHEGAVNVRVENNFIFGAGADCRGNGREENEDRIKWGDGITFAARDSVVRNNLIIDPTDVGFVLFGSPGTVAEENVVASVSRESLGGANMVDPIGYYRLGENETDYRGVKVRDNLVDAFGARVHIGYPMGAAVWAPRLRGQILCGAEVTGNTMAGDAGAYGFVAHGVRDWKVAGNTSTASYSGVADGLGPNRRAHEPAPFVYDPATVQNVDLQEEFVNCRPHIEHLLRCNHGPKDERGYRIYPYGEAEAVAVVRAAYLEMLGRPVEEHELRESVALLQANTLNADSLRRRLMDSAEFENQLGHVAPEDLHSYRTGLWLGIYAVLVRDALTTTGQWPAARDVYHGALDTLQLEKRSAFRLARVGRPLQVEANDVH